MEINTDDNAYMYMRNGVYHVTPSRELAMQRSETDHVLVLNNNTSE